MISRSVRDSCLRLIIDHCSVDHIGSRVEACSLGVFLCFLDVRFLGGHSPACLFRAGYVSSTLFLGLGFLDWRAGACFAG
jgi:hypothetical protein